MLKIVLTLQSVTANLVMFLANAGKRIMGCNVLDVLGLTLFLA
jgi:hypothetical protein